MLVDSGVSVHDVVAKKDMAAGHQTQEQPLEQLGIAFADLRRPSARGSGHSGLTALSLQGPTAI